MNTRDSIPAADSKLRDALLAQLRQEGIPVDAVAEIWVSTITATNRIAMEIQQVALQSAADSEKPLNHKQLLNLLEAAARAQDRVRRALKDFAAWRKSVTPKAPSTRRAAAPHSASQTRPLPATPPAENPDTAQPSTAAYRTEISPDQHGTALQPQGSPPQPSAAATDLPRARPPIPSPPKHNIWPHRPKTP